MKYRACKICGMILPYNVIHFMKHTKHLHNVCCYCEDVAKTYVNQKIMKDNKKEALKRDGYKCVECGSIKGIEVHHIIKLKDGGNSEVSNLVTLCIKCHTNKHLTDESVHLMKKKILKYN